MFHSLLPLLSENRHPSRQLLLAVAVAIVVTTAGCAGGIGGGDAGTVDQVPDNANFLVHVDMAVLEDEDSEQLLDGLAEEETGEDEAEDLFQEFEDETGLDLRGASEVLVFGEIPENQMAQQERVGVIIHADWAEDDLVSSVEEEQDTEYQQTEYQGESVLYEPAEEPQFGTPMYLGVLGDGQYVIGEEESVRGALDVVYGDADPVSGPVRDIYDEASDGYVTIAAAPPAGAIPENPGAGMGQDLDFSAFQELQALSVVYDTTDGDAAVETKMVAADENDAQDIEDVTSGALSLVRGSVQDEALTDELRKVEVDRDGATITVSYQSDIDDILDLLDQF